MARSIPNRLWLEKLAREAHYHPGELARRLGLSEWQLRRMFQQHLKCSPRAWLTALRVQDVAASLHADDLAKTAASNASFKHPSSFSRWFKSHTGVTASEFTAPLPPSSTPERRPEV